MTLSEQSKPINMRHKAMEGTYFWWPYLTWPWPWPVLCMSSLVFLRLDGSLKSIHGQTGFDPVLFYHLIIISIIWPFVTWPWPWVVTLTFMIGLNMRMVATITLSEQSWPINMRHKAMEGTYFWWPYLTWPWPWPVLSMSSLVLLYLSGSLKSIHAQTGFDPVLCVASRGDIVKRSIFDLWPDLWPHNWP